MILKSRDGAQFELSIVGYETPQIEDQKYDSNWLLIYTGVKKAGDVWSFTDASLLTWELRDFINWLERFTLPGLSHGRMAFTKPGLSFEATQLSDTLFSLQIEHRNSNADSSVSLKAELIIRTEDLTYAIEQMRAEFDRFPPRAGVR